MKFFDIALEMLWGLQNRSSVKYEVYESNIPSNDETIHAPEPTNVATIFSAAKILSSAVSQMTVRVLKENEDYDNFREAYSLKYRMSEIYNNQAFWSTLEYHRNIYGNAFVDRRNGSNRIIHPALISDYDFKGPNDGLRFHISWSRAKELVGKKYKSYKKEDEWVDAKDLYHFKGLSVDGVFGLPPVSAIAQSMTIMDRASNTIMSFYKNRALSPMALESTVNSAAGAKLLSESVDIFKRKYGGTYNAGKVVQLPPNTKLTPLAIHFADAELIATMRFTRDEIYTMYGIPRFLWAAGGEVQYDIEQQSLNFKTFTLAPIARVYEEELMYKLLTKRERKAGVVIKFDMEGLLEADLKTKATAYKDMLMSGIVSPNEAAEKLGFSTVDSAWADEKYLQSQMIAISNFGKDNPLMTSSDANNSSEDSGKENGDNTSTDSENKTNNT